MHHTILSAEQLYLFLIFPYYESSSRGSPALTSLRLYTEPFMMLCSVYKTFSIMALTLADKKTNLNLDLNLDTFNDEHICCCTAGIRERHSCTVKLKSSHLECRFLWRFIIFVLVLVLLFAVSLKQIIIATSHH